MNQLSLFPTPEPRPTGFNMILAIFPDRHTARDIYEFGTKLRDKHGLGGRVRPLNHLHISLPCLNNVAGELNRMLELLDCACKEIADTTSPFEVTFDRVLSFKRQTSDHPLVLVGSEDGNAELRAFHRLLVEKLSRLSNRGGTNPKFTPHMTLLYDRQIKEEPVSPVSWKVNEIVLVQSHVGATKYDRLGRWTLAS